MDPLVKTIAEAFNLLRQSRVDGLTGEQLVQAGQIVSDMQDIIKNLVDGSLTISYTEEGGDDETS